MSFYPKRFFRKLPRAQLYGDGFSLLVAALKAIFGSLEKNSQAAELEKQYALRYQRKHTKTLSTARLCLNFTLRAMELPPGSEVLMTPLTIADMVNMIRAAGHKPVFVEMEPGSFNLDMEDFEKKITPKSRVLLITYLMGLVPDMDQIVETAQKHNLQIIEDISQNYGSSYKGKLIGTYGVASIASVSMMKTVCGYIGGIFSTDNDILFRKFAEICDREIKVPIPRRILLKLLIKNIQLIIATSTMVFSVFTYYLVKLLTNIFPRVIANFQRGNINMLTGEPDPILRDTVSEKLLFGFSDIQAGLVLNTMADSVTGNRKRKELVQELMETVNRKHHPRLPQPADFEGSVFWRYSVMVDDPKRFRQFMLERYIDTGLTNLFCCSTVNEFAEYKSPTPIASRIMSNAVLLPIHADTMGPRDMQWIGQAINDYFEVCPGEES